MGFYPPGSFTYIVTQTTTVHKTGAGVLRRIIINKPLANGVITIYNNSAGSGALIGIITMPATLLSDGPHSVPYDVPFTVGLTTVTSGANQDITVIWE